LPTDLLAATRGACVKNLAKTFAPRVAKLLEGPVAEQHMHLGAAFNFETIWLGLARFAGDPVRGIPQFKSHKSPATFRAQVHSALLTRLVLARFLAHSSVGQFEKYIQDEFPLWCNAQAGSSWHGRSTLRTSLGAIKSLLGNVKSSFADVHLAYRVLGGLPQHVTSIENLKDRDPVAHIGRVPTGHSSEKWLTTRGCDFLAQNRDELFARVFWQYQRVRCSLFRFVTLEPGTSGLDWFKSAYERIDEVTTNIKPLRTESAFSLAGTACALKALELRKAPPKRWSEVPRDICKLHKGSAKSGAEMGIIYHFLKEHRRATKEPHASPERGDWRHGEWFRERQVEELALKTALRFAPHSMTFIRGLDVANAEMAQPLWLVHRLLGSVRKSSEKIANPSRPPLQVTVHIAEEYCRVSEGLRNIGEALEFGVVRANDRLGHALALGDSAYSQPRVVQPREERLFDLLWLLRQECGPKSVHRALRELTVAIGEAIFGKPLAIEELQTLRMRLFTPGFVEFLGFPRGARRRQGKVADLALNYLRDPDIYRRATHPIEVPFCRQEAELITAVQTLIRYQLRSLKIVVETNPSSNRLIGDLMGAPQHPLASAVADSLGAAPEFSINSDDPITFATKLADEYVYMYAALRTELGSEEAALIALEEVRESALRSRFTLANSADSKRFLLFP
jgi:hypothetical protein